MLQCKATLQLSWQQLLGDACLLLQYLQCWRAGAGHNGDTEGDGNRAVVEQPHGLGDPVVNPQGTKVHHLLAGIGQLDLGSGGCHVMCVLYNGEYFSRISGKTRGNTLFS